MTRSTLLVLAVSAIGITAASSNAAITWTSVVTRTDTGNRSLRGVALNSGATSVYAGFLQGSSTASLYQYTLAGDPPVGTLGGSANISAFNSSADSQAEAVVVDDRGLVIAATVKDSTSGFNAKLNVFSSNLSSNTSIGLADIGGSSTTGETIGGIDFRLSGTDRQVYVTRFKSSTAYIERYNLTGTGVADAGLTLDTSFNGTGQFNLRGVSGFTTAASLRGIDVAADGTMYVASREGNTVYRIAPDLSVSSVTLSNAMDLALYDGKVFVTQYAGAASQISVLDAATLATITSFDADPPFSLASSGAGYAGIDIDSLGRIYLADQIYATNSDRILVSSPVPEPTTLAAIGGAATLLLRRRRA